MKYIMLEQEHRLHKSKFPLIKTQGFLALFLTLSVLVCGSSVIRKTMDRIYGFGQDERVKKLKQKTVWKAVRPSVLRLLVRSWG